MSAGARRLEWTASRGLQLIGSRWMKGMSSPQEWRLRSTILRSIIALKQLRALAAAPSEAAIHESFHRMVVSFPMASVSEPTVLPREVLDVLSVGKYDALPKKDRSEWVRRVLVHWAKDSVSSWSAAECVDVLYAIACSGMQQNDSPHADLEPVIAACVKQVQAFNETLDFFSLSAAAWSMMTLSAQQQSTVLQISVLRISTMMQQSQTIATSQRLAHSISMLCEVAAAAPECIPTGFMVSLGEYAGRSLLLDANVVATIGAMGGSNVIQFINGWWAATKHAQQLDAHQLTQLLRLITLDPFCGATFKARVCQLQTFASQTTTLQSSAVGDLISMLHTIVLRVPNDAVDAMCVRTLSIDVCRRIQLMVPDFEIVGAGVVALSHAQDVVEALHTAIDWSALQRALHDAIVQGAGDAPFSAEAADIIASIFDIDHADRVDLQSLTKLLTTRLGNTEGGAARGAVFQAQLDACANSTSPIGYATRAEPLWAFIWSDVTHVPQVDQGRCLEALRRLPGALVEVAPTVQAVLRHCRCASPMPCDTTDGGLMMEIDLLVKEEPLEAQRRAARVAKALAVWQGPTSNRIQLMCGLMDALPNLGSNVGCLEVLFVGLNPNDTQWLSELPLLYSMALLEGVRRLSGVVDTFPAIEHQVLTSMALTVERLIACCPLGDHHLVDEAIAALILLESLYQRSDDCPLPAAAANVVLVLSTFLSASRELLNGRQRALVATVCVLLDVPQPLLHAHDIRGQLDSL